MEPQRTSVAVCVFAALMFVGSGFEFQLSDDYPYTDRLICSVDANSSSLDIFTVIGLTISDVTNNKTSVKMAAISVLETGLYVDHASKAFIDVQGSVTQYGANLAVTFSNQTYCAFCSYLCELQFITSAGHPVSVRKALKLNRPENGNLNHEVSVGVANQIAAAVDRLTYTADGIEASLTTLTQKLEKKLDNIADLLTKGPGAKQRANGEEDFYRNWTDYKYGFGQVANGGDYWLGNEAIHQLSFMGTFELLVDMHFGGKKYYAQYGKFFVEDLANKYRLNIGNYSGDAPDSLNYHNGYPFSTFDMDSNSNSGNCAVGKHGAWWYNSCEHSSLNSAWGTGNFAWNGVGNRLSFTEMKMRLFR